LDADFGRADGPSAPNILAVNADRTNKDKHTKRYMFFISSVDCIARV